MKPLKKIPTFKSEAAAAKFWLRADSTEYLDFSKAQQWVFPDLKLTSRPITIRLPEGLLARVKVQAHVLDMPYQTLIKQYIRQGLSA
ncbi:BrnA antitoxin family protein [Candidatus Gottesmanbacteria bacterium]|nr:BrnA antitoxin family protein [Candidatus Gottesmanbacteria bacterium]